ncbi:hypothetical protein [Thalassotalea piscium]|uniref:Uncharacterized protein n=1 Tax=Thalassotalea piscium TaxID=1230533 RepID=A0A7X0NGM4_9GAMM|nr:hypothetical protein [Thalassotalea piscium]MBB6543112.1 hypothetical protein [Thalassotalea piscium]
MKIKFIHIFMGIGVGFLISAILESNAIIALVGFVMLAFSALAEFLVTNQKGVLVQNFLMNVFVATTSTIPFKQGETMVQLMCISYIFGLAYVVLLMFEEYNRE